jgi:threonine dehydratase
MLSPDRYDHIDVAAAAERIRGVLKRTPLAPFPSGDASIELRLKLECLQETGSFKPRGAWNQVSQLTADERALGVVATSSGNHGKALAWAARRAGVPATIFMPRDAYANKIEACRDYGADVVLCDGRAAAEAACGERVAAGAVLIHPYDAERTAEGAGTVGLEIAEDWPEVDVVVFPVGGGGLLAGSALALRRALADRVRILGVEPEGAPSMSRGIAAGHPVELTEITTAVQGLCPLQSGHLNVALAAVLVDRVSTLADERIFEAQARLVNEGGWDVEPAGAAATALVLSGGLAAEAQRARWTRPLRVVAVVSGGNPAPEQLAEIRALAGTRR